MIQLKDLAATDQVRLSAKVFELQERQRATRAAVERALRTPEVQALVRSVMARKQAPRPRVASHPSIIQRNSSPSREQRARDYITTAQATLARSKRELAEMRRKVARERAGVR